jgi:hypothetical protein
MQSRTRKLAARVQRSLLALSDEGLAETIAHWIHTIEDLYEDVEVVAYFCESLGYRIQSETTGQIYDSLEALYEAEPEWEDVHWIPPEASALRELLRRKQPKPIYHQVVALAGEALRTAIFTSRWGEPPGEQSDGYAFMGALSAYLTLKQEAGLLPTEQFEDAYEEQLEALGAPKQEDEEELFFDEEGLFLLELPFAFPSPKKRKKSRKQKQRSRRN